MAAPYSPPSKSRALYYGSAWSSGPQKAQLESSLQSLATGAYLNNLTSSYGVGSGSFSSGVIDGVSLVPNPPSVNDTSIQSTLQAEITSGMLYLASTNRLYVVYVEPNIEVINGSQNSVHDFAGYHAIFHRHSKRGDHPLRRRRYPLWDGKQRVVQR